MAAPVPVPRSCCDAVWSFLEPNSTCNCDQGLMELLPTAGVTVDGLDGMLEFMVNVCDLDADISCP